MGARAKAEVADYVLVYRNTKLAVIEAKAWDKPLTEGVGQAKRYAAKLAVRHAYATNGQAIYGIDMVSGAEGDVASYPGPDELWKLTHADVNAWRDRFAAVPFEDKGGTWQGHYYQDIAIGNALQAIADGRDRILFLADRNILADQAYNAFSAFADRSPGTLVRIAPDEVKRRR